MGAAGQSRAFHGDFGCQVHQPEARRCKSGADPIVDGTGESDPAPCLEHAELPNRDRRET